MNPPFDVAVAGAGIAGASAALQLSHDYRILLLDAGDPSTAPPQGIAGLINPMLGRRARPVWRVDETLAAVEEAIEHAEADHLYDDRGVLRPAVHADQVSHFIEAAEMRPDLAVWLPPERAAEEFPDVRVEHGALRVLRGGAINAPAFIAGMIRKSISNGADFLPNTRLSSWTRDSDGVVLQVERKEGIHEIQCRRLVLALGDGFKSFEALSRLDLHRVKGQTIRVRRPEGVGQKCAIPPLSGSGYVVPEIATWVLGSTYEHDFTSIEPTPEADAEILDKVRRMVPALGRPDVIDRRSGIRVTVPRRRLPMVGPIENDNVWVMIGMGSKGLLMAPFIARNLPRWMEHPATLPNELRPLSRE